MRLEKTCYVLMNKKHLKIDWDVSCVTHSAIGDLVY